MKKNKEGQKNNGMFHEFMNVVPKQIVRRLFEYPNANPKLYDSQVVYKLSNNNNYVPKKDFKNEPKT